MVVTVEKEGQLLGGVAVEVGLAVTGPQTRLFGKSLADVVTWP